MSSIFTTIFPFLKKKNSDIQEEKKRIRNDIHYLKKDISEEAKLLDEKKVFDKIEKLDVFSKADTILIYWAIKNELPTQQTIAKWSEYKTILLPSIEGDKLLLKSYKKEGKMVQKKLGIMEPELDEYFKGRIDLVIVPGVAFDRNKNRLGRGKGYYDRFFRKFKPVKIGVGFDCQLLKTVPTNKYDQKMDIIITPNNTIE